MPQAAAGPDAGDPSATATRIEAGKEFSFQIEVLHKRNYFKVKSPGDGVLRLELTKELEQHRSLFPWWGEIESEDGKRREFRSGIWDRRVAKGEEVILAVRSNLHSFNEVAHDEVIRAKVVFMPEEFEGPPNPADSVRRWSFSIERTSPSQ